MKYSLQMRTQGFLKLTMVPVVAVLLFVMACVAQEARAEPWLSTRYAQNCAGCHAPGRKNLPPIDRRCSLSCQGCHVNPNGGGLRSGYGKWNEERWLRSFRSDVLRNQPSFAPTAKQHYGKADVAAKSKKGKEKPSRKKRSPGRDGFPLVEIDNTQMPESIYDRRDGLEKVETAGQHDEAWLYQVPQQDPFRLLEQSKTDAGADIRWQTSSISVDGEDPKWRSFLMSADFGLRWRPLYRNVHFVYEARMMGNPDPDTTYEQTLGKAATRSLYLMVDNLPWNIFVMAGYYRPLFGNFVPDHYALAQEITSYAMSGNTKNYALLYNAVTIGTAPNVPYLNVHLINKQVGDPDDRTSGFAANLGLRFVTLGASINYSYWRTQDKRSEQITGVEMHSIGAAARIWRIVTSLEAVSVARDMDTQDYRLGGVWALDTYTQLWRENYFTLMYSVANVTRDIKPGDTTQLKTGVRSFIIPGVEVMLLSENLNEKIVDPKTDEVTTRKSNGYTGQLHVFF